MKLETVLLGNRYKFSSIKEVLAKANEQKVVIRSQGLLPLTPKNE